jgi:hypothetical protein
MENTRKQSYSLYPVIDQSYKTRRGPSPQIISSTKRYHQLTCYSQERLNDNEYLCLTNAKSNKITLIVIKDSQIVSFQVRISLALSDYVSHAHIISSDPLLVTILSHQGQFIILDVTKEYSAHNSAFSMMATSRPKPSHSTKSNRGHENLLADSNQGVVKFLCKLKAESSAIEFLSVTSCQSDGDGLHVTGYLVLTNGFVCSYDIHEKTNQADSVKIPIELAILPEEEDLSLSSMLGHEAEHRLVSEAEMIHYGKQSTYCYFDGQKHPILILRAPSSQIVVLWSHIQQLSINDDSSKNESESDDGGEVWKDCDSEEDEPELANAKLSQISRSNKYFDLTIKSANDFTHSQTQWSLADNLLSEALTTEEDMITNSDSEPNKADMDRLVMLGICDAAVLGNWFYESILRLSL